MTRVALISSLFLSVTAVTLNAQVPHFQHIVVIVQENRTPDNMFQGLCAPPYGSSQSCNITPGPGQYNIQTANWYDKKSDKGVTQPEPVPLANDYDLSHSHHAFQQMCDNLFALNTPCKMDGAADVDCSGTCPRKPQYRYVDNSTGILDPYLDIATQYGFANYMFQTNQGPSFPAHQFIFGSTSAPSASDDASGVFAADDPSSSRAGCIAPEGATVKLIVPPGYENSSIYPCFEHQTMGDFQQAFSWKYYTPSASSIVTAPVAISHICQSSGYGGRCEGTQFTDNVDVNPADVLTDVRGCNLRDVSWVVPTMANSDHARSNDGGGPSWVASIVNAIGASQQCDGGRGYWYDTAIFITWDDWGGWYDHEVPTMPKYPQSDYQYGFRVPLMVVSAYTPAGYIDNGGYDFGSIQRFIEQNFGLAEGALGFADARAKNDLTVFFTDANHSRTFRNIYSPLDANFFTNDKRPLKDPDDD